jgi:hypothetical protein
MAKHLKMDPLIVLQNVLCICYIQMGLMDGATTFSRMTHSKKKKN